MKKGNLTKKFTKKAVFSAFLVIALSFLLWLPFSEIFFLSEEKPSTFLSTQTQTDPAIHAPINHRLELRTKKNSQAKDLRTAIFAAHNLQGQDKQLAEMSRLIAESSKEQIIALMNSMNKEQLEADGVLQFFSHWALTSPRDAISWARQHFDPEINQTFLRLASTVWAKSDFQEAVTWARSLPTGETRESMITAISAEAVRFAPMEALHLATELPHSSTQTELIRRATAEWAVTNHDQALEWVKSIQDDKLRQQVMEMVILSSADQNPEKSAHLAIDEMPEGAAQDRVVVSIIQRWAQTDPQAAAAWVCQFPEGNLQTDAVENLINQWANQDLHAVGDWVKSLPNGKMREASSRYFAQVLSKKDPATALQWAVEK